MAKTRRNATLAAAALAVGGGTAAARKRRSGRAWAPAERGMCFQLATLAAVDAGQADERIVL